MTPIELATIAIIIGVVSLALFFIINVKVNAMRDILRDYCDRTNTLCNDSREVRAIVPPDRLIERWQSEMDKAKKGSVRWTAYRNQLKKYHLINDGD